MVLCWNLTGCDLLLRALKVCMPPDLKISDGQTIGRMLPEVQAVWCPVVCNRVGICHRSPARRTHTARTLINVFHYFLVVVCESSLIFSLFFPEFVVGSYLDTPWIAEQCLVWSMGVSDCSTHLYLTASLTNLLQLFSLCAPSRICQAACAGAGHPGRPACWRGAPRLPSHSYLSRFLRWIIYQRCFCQKFGQQMSSLIIPDFFSPVEYMVSFLKREWRCFVFRIPKNRQKKNVSLLACVLAVTKDNIVLIPMPQIPAQLSSSLCVRDSH